ncbi:MAG: hypothetical protein HZA77_12670 [Candidatus Schekmanbacteria bacterium]|nr:hypothetical protein [Candidatus Schekmanbacteria bacterium]
MDKKFISSLSALSDNKEVLPQFINVNKELQEVLLSCRKKMIAGKVKEE